MIGKAPRQTTRKVNVIGQALLYHIHFRNRLPGRASEGKEGVSEKERNRVILEEMRL